ncbi:MAG: hypothetical protein HYS05_16765 [Acidobacteria bacterium]|nr:hypothetical protein [Acidobacteriota bacterium]
MWPQALFVVVTALLLLSPSWITATAGAQELTVSPHAQPPPDELAADVKPLLAAGGATAKVRATTIDLWFVKKQTTGIAHPAIFSLDPPVTTEPVL